MAKRNCRGVSPSERSRAEATAAALIAQGRDVAAQTMETEDMPMNRYTYPHPGAAPPGAECRAVPCSESGELLERILETQCCQNQLLLDILGAVNALTAALLSAQCHR